MINSFDRSLIEKTGYDHGWEVSEQPADLSVVVMVSARHPGRVMVRPNGSSGWLLQFNEAVNITELRRSFPSPYFTGVGVSVPGWNILGAVLTRAAQLGENLPSHPLVMFQSKVKEVLSEDPAIRGTEKEVIVRQRIGQGLYRDALMGYWNGCCAVTGVDVPEVLRASHAKPWAACESDAERLDVFNGLLLTANLDALFDRGLITFDDDGKMNVSSRLDPSARRQLGIEEEPRLRWISEQHEQYLAWHRRELFS